MKTIDGKHLEQWEQSLCSGKRFFFINIEMEAHSLPLHFARGQKSQNLDKQI